MRRHQNLIKHVTDAYAMAGDKALDNQQLYDSVAAKAGIAQSELNVKVAIGKSGQERSVLKREIRWHQQTLKHMGLLEKSDSGKGVWKLTKEGRHQMKKIDEGVALLAFSTDLGIAIWGSCSTVFSKLNTDIHLVLTSPPYPLAQPRAYGNPKESEFVDFICSALEPVIEQLVPGGSICINIGNDIFLKGSPARSLYNERLVLALNDRFGLSLMDRLIWENKSKPPGPIQWASLKRVQLNVSYEPVLWFTNDPHKVRSDNRRVLQQHTEKHLQFVAAGGDTRNIDFADGAYRARPGNFGKPTAGRIPRNVLSYGHNCPDHKEYRRDCSRLGVQSHGAPMPISLAEFLIKFLTVPGETVADPFGGKLTTARAAEALGRKWITTEIIWEYLRGAAERFSNCYGYELAL